jgi:hypothetical protein
MQFTQMSPKKFQELLFIASLEQGSSPHFHSVYKYFFQSLKNVEKEKAQD